MYLTLANLYFFLTLTVHTQIALQKIENHTQKFLHFITLLYIEFVLMLIRVKLIV